MPRPTYFWIVLSGLSRSLMLFLLPLLIATTSFCVESINFSATSDVLLPLENVNVLITAPPSYATRLQDRLESAGASVLSCPTVVTEFLPESDKDSHRLIEIIKKIIDNYAAHDASPESEGAFNLSYDYVAFTSRRGIQAMLNVGGSSLVKCFQNQNPTAIALGVDTEELVAAGVDRSVILVPTTPTPDGIVEMLRSKMTKESERNYQNDYNVEIRPLRILCPVPKVLGGLTEPTVVPNFLSNLCSIGCEVDRLHAYVTRWTGPSNDAERIMQKLQEGAIDVIAVSSTAEVEGLKLFCREYHLDWDTFCSTSTHTTMVAAHGPVTAAGARALGLPIHAVSKDSSSFAGMIGAVSECLNNL